MRYIFFSLFTIISFFLNSQNTAIEDSLIEYRNKSLTIQNDSIKRVYNNLFITTLKGAFNEFKKHAYFLDSIPFVSHLVSDNGYVDIFSWNIVDEYQNHLYYSLIVHQYKKKNNFYELAGDESNFTKNCMYKETSSKGWLGAIYYDLIEVKNKKEFYYVLLGFNVNSKVVQKKFIDVLSFSNNRLELGKKIFKMPNGKIQSRIIFEYSKNISMSVKYHEKRKQIIFDHLSPEENSKTGFFSFYGPDFTYDAIELKKDRKWYYVSNVEVFGDVNKPYNIDIKNEETPIYKPK